MILYLSVIAFIIYSSKTFPFNFLEIDVFYQGPPVIQSELCLSISYSKCWFVLIIYSIPTWCNTVFNTNTVIISWYVVFILAIDIIVYFTQLQHLISIFPLYFDHHVPYYTNNESETLKTSLTMTVTLLFPYLSCLHYNP